MFQFSGLASLSRCYVFNIAGCPIRRSGDIILVCSSPRLIAAYHVLHRLSEPRHPPYALKCFKRVITITRFLQLKINYYPICQRANSMCRCTNVQIAHEYIAIEQCDDCGYEPPGHYANIMFERTFFVEDIGVEPMTLCVQGRCSSQLS